jgi:hypothetical protein
MTSDQFVIWFKGFVQASNAYNITPKQWDTICEQLNKVVDTNHTGGYLIPNKPGLYGTTTTAERRNDTSYNNDTLSTKTLITDNTIF